MICETDSSCANFSDVVFDLTSTYSNNTLVQNPSTLPMSDTMYVHSETEYALLERCDISNEMTKLPPKTIKIYGNMICKKITLLNFSCGQYILNLNGQNCATARCENITKDNIDYVFDFSQERSKILETIMSASTAVGVEHITENKEHYLNLCRIDNIRINSSVNFQDGISYRIKLEGYSKDDNNEWTFDEKIMEVYPNSYRLNLNHPTDCIDLQLKKINQFENGTMILRIDGKIYAKCKFHYDSIGLRIKCKNLPNISFPKGAQNNLLSENINQNTINFSRVDVVELILTNCTYSSAHQYRYMCYHYPSRCVKFSN